jgi:hypothetical protein
MFKQETYDNKILLQTNEIENYLKFEIKKYNKTCTNKSFSLPTANALNSHHQNNKFKDVSVSDFKFSEEYQISLDFRKHEKDLNIIFHNKQHKKKNKNLPLIQIENSKNTFLVNTNITEKIILNTLEYFDYEALSATIQSLCTKKQISLTDFYQYDDMPSLIIPRSTKKAINNFTEIINIEYENNTSDYKKELILAKYDNIQLIAFNINFNSLFKICNKQLERFTFCTTSSFKPIIENICEGFDYNFIDIEELAFSKAPNLSRFELTDNPTNIVNLEFTDSNFELYVEKIDKLHLCSGYPAKLPKSNKTFLIELGGSVHADKYNFTDLPELSFNKKKGSFIVLDNNEKVNLNKRKHNQLETPIKNNSDVNSKNRSKRVKLVENYPKLSQTNFIVINNKIKAKLDFDNFLNYLNKNCLNYHILEDNIIPDLDIIVDIYSCVIILNPNQFTDEYDSNGYEALYLNINKYYFKFNRFFLFFGTSQVAGKIKQNLENFLKARLTKNYKNVEFIITNKLEDIFKEKSTKFDSILFPILDLICELYPIFIEFHNFPLLNVLEIIIFIIAKEKKQLSQFKVYIIEVMFY